jgi:hypothetical protein
MKKKFNKLVEIQIENEKYQNSGRMNYTNPINHSFTIYNCQVQGKKITHCHYSIKKYLFLLRQPSSRIYCTQLVIQRPIIHPATN